uniref:Signal peptidase complex subunit 1 n=1 Tax=Knipowitschia caucasica TaxID=637954 RepID=A0AAV2M6J1_KNICA
MDYKGQKLAEQIFQGIILVSAAIGFIYGLIVEQFGWTVYIVLAGFAVSCVLTLPPWPMYRQSPLAWQPSVAEGSALMNPDCTPLLLTTNLSLVLVLHDPQRSLQQCDPQTQKSVSP